MSTQLPESTPDGLARRRAAWALGVLALVAVIISAITVFFLGTSSGTHQDAGLPSTAGSPLAGPSSSTPPPTDSAASSTPVHPRPSTSTPGTTATASCPSSAPCVLQGDAGQAGAAIDAYRSSHHQPSVLAGVSPSAQSCAINSGDGGSCPASYFWEPVATLDGAAVVGKIAAHSNGSAWLLDPHATSFAVGWAYAPGAGGAAGQVEGVIVKVDQTG